MANEFNAPKYVFVGSAEGVFDTQDGRKQPYCNMYVLSELGGANENYHPSGFKAEKLKCVESDVFSGLFPGQEVELFFDSRSRVAYCKATGNVFAFPKAD